MQYLLFHQGSSNFHWSDLTNRIPHSYSLCSILFHYFRLYFIKSFLIFFMALSVSLFLLLDELKRIIISFFVKLIDLINLLLIFGHQELVALAGLRLPLILHSLNVLHHFADAGRLWLWHVGKLIVIYVCIIEITFFIFITKIVFKDKTNVLYLLFFCFFGNHATYFIYWTNFIPL